MTFRDHNAAILLNRGLTPHRVSLEDYVAYQWEARDSLIGCWHGERRNSIVLRWLSDAVTTRTQPASVLDVGCSYGNHLFMLNAFLGKPQDVRMVGVDLFTDSVARANSFARLVPGYANCSFTKVDLAKGLAFEAESFDAVNFCDVIEHMVSPGGALRELCRVTKTGGVVVVSTPLKDGVFKRLAAFCNRAAGGRLYRAYYAGKDASIDAGGHPIMAPPAGHNHVSELTFTQMNGLCRENGFEIEKVELMSVMSGSRFFDKHLILLAGVIVVEALHEVLRRPSWAHSVVMRLRKRD